MRDSGLSGKIASKLYYHEKAHADADDEGSGEFGFVITPGWVIAYYMIHGERSPEQMMKIASAPGFSQMSNKDWEIYNRAWREWRRKVTEIDASLPQKSNPDSYNGLRDLLTSLIAEKLDSQYGDDALPPVENLLQYEFKDLISEFGPLVYRAYAEALSEFNKMLFGEENESGNTDSGDIYISPN